MDQPPHQNSEAPPKAPVPPDDIQLLKAFHSVVASLPQLGGMVIGLVAVGYFVGWKASCAYYGAFGAEWVASLLSPSELLQQSYTVLSGIVSGVLGTMLVTLDRLWSKKLIQRIDLVIAVLGFLLLIVASCLDGCHAETSAAYVTLSASFLWSFSISSSIVLHVYAIRDNERQPESTFLRLGYLLWFFVAYQMPTYDGRPRGQLAADPQSSNLPFVTTGGETWRLLLARQERLILVRLEKGKMPVIRIVPIEKVDSIQARPASQEETHRAGSQPDHFGNPRVDGGAG
jgi:hypothetical protein